MIDDMLRRNWSTLHNHTMDLKSRHSTKAARAKPEGNRKLWIDRGTTSPISLHARRGVFYFRGALLNSFKHIVHNSITSHGMKSGQVMVSGNLFQWVHYCGAATAHAGPQKTVQLRKGGALSVTVTSRHGDRSGGDSRAVWGNHGVLRFLRSRPHQEKRA
jgi:hypothetical protein